MKHLGLVHILLLFLVAGLFLGPATAELTASQNVPPSANVGENVMVTVVLTYSGSNATQAIITPGLPPGLETNYPGGQAMELYPGLSAPISYPIRAMQSGTYLVTSLVSYSEEGTWRNLRLESPFTASGQLEPGQMQPYPGQANCPVFGRKAAIHTEQIHMGHIHHGINPNGHIRMQQIHMAQIRMA